MGTLQSFLKNSVDLPISLQQKQALSVLGLKIYISNHSLHAISMGLATLLISAGTILLYKLLRRGSLDFLRSST